MSESETRCPMCEKVIREDDLYEDGCPFCGTWLDSGPPEPWDADECRCVSGMHTCGKPNVETL